MKEREREREREREIERKIEREGDWNKLSEAWVEGFDGWGVGKTHSSTQVLEQAQKEMLDFEGMGMSVMGLSERPLVLYLLLSSMYRSTFLCFFCFLLSSYSLSAIAFLSTLLLFILNRDQPP